MRDRRGIALVLISGLLVLLAATAAAFLRISESVRLSSGAQALGARARLLALSGVERALHGTARNPLPSPRDPETDWRWRDTATVPLADARNPSFHHRRLEPWLDDGNGTFDGEGYTDLDDNGRYSGFSGRLRGTLSETGDTYTLKVEDESAKINVNGGLLDAGDRDSDGTPDHRDADVRVVSAASDIGYGWNRQLARVLDILGDQPEVGVPGLGQAAVTNRPAGGYVSTGHLRATVAAALAVPVPDLSPWTTVSSWIDRSVVTPDTYFNIPFAGVSWETTSEPKKRYQPRVEEGGRPPVNLNACSRPVLVALLQGVASRSSIGMDGPSATAIAGQIAARRDANPFDTWEEFRAYLMSFASFWGRNAVLANFDPNTRANKQIADELMYMNEDKTDLGTWSTEGSLGPTGTFRIASLGRVCDPRGAPQAAATVAAAAEVFSLLRQTTQSDFVGGRTPSVAADSYASLADPALRTYGADASWNTWAPGRGLAVATVPNPMTALPAAASVLDGAIGLATTEQPPGEYAPGAPLLFLHHFDDSWDAEPGSGAPAQIPSNHNTRLQTDLAADTWPPSPAEPNTIYPDGAHLQRDRSPTFAAAGNFPPFSGAPAGNRGAVTFWTKSLGYGYNSPLDSSKPRLYFHVRRWTGDPLETQSLMCGESAEYYGITVENIRENNDVQHEQACRAYVSNSYTIHPGTRWYLYSACFDTNESLKTLQTLVRVGGLTPAGGTDWNRYASAIDATTNQDLLSEGAEMILGMNGTSASGTHRANCLMDELAIYDLGDDGGAAQTLLDAMHADRLRDGRYYKRDDGTFLSAPLAPGGGRPARILRSQWTAFVPSDPRPEWKDNSTPGFPGFWSPRPQDARLARARVEVDLVDDADPTAVLTPLAQGGAVNLPRAAFRYRVRFVNGLAEAGFDPLNEGVLESPWFDDITFLWQDAAGPRVLAWTEP